MVEDHLQPSNDSASVVKFNHHKLVQSTVFYLAHLQYQHEYFI